MSTTVACRWQSTGCFDVPVRRLNGESFSMVAQYMAAMPVKELKEKLFNVEHRRNEIVAALDLLLQGF
ncbi:MAG: CcdB family protein [Thauera sp.]|nr:CcdB family protein [Thauera sp.]